MKIEFSSQGPWELTWARGEMLLFLTINMAAVTSHAYQQCVYVLDTCGLENF